jgi:hypothetical protein
VEFEREICVQMLKIGEASDKDIDFRRVVENVAQECNELLRFFDIDRIDVIKDQQYVSVLQILYDFLYHLIALQIALLPPQRQTPTDRVLLILLLPQFPTQEPFLMIYARDDSFNTLNIFLIIEDHSIPINPFFQNHIRHCLHKTRLSHTNFAFDQYKLRLVE